VKPQDREANAKALRDYRARWAKVNAVTDAEYRNLSVAERVRQFFELMEQAKALGWKTTDEREVEVVRARWRKLHEASGG